MIKIQEIRYVRKHDIGICFITKRKTQWNDACRDGFRCREHIGGRPYIVCFNCEKWEGKSRLEQSRLDREEDKKEIRKILDRRRETMVILS